ncbi:hypothetical protein [Paenibacillus kandeliae]|uniref:hypothetical protein n=1 Tax=Paenibacillus kandeliae TaxID=3231269 RepID=UPI003457F0F6
MNIIFFIFASIGFFAGIGLLIASIILYTTKNYEAKKFFFFTGSAFAFCFLTLLIGITITIIPKETESAQSSIREQITSNLEKTEVSLTPKQDKPSVVDEKVNTITKGITIDANGIFAVNNEVHPGLYRNANGNLYWARLSGFTGDVNEIIANRSADELGPTIVEIDETDEGFETNGTGTWVLIDSSYQANPQSTFKSGTYIVGKDIKPGKYKSDGSMVYWERLSSFKGDIDSVIANGTPEGPSIVEIKSTDKGFATSGSGSWVKID